jgi:hypothetical protein
MLDKFLIMNKNNGFLLHIIQYEDIKQQDLKPFSVK